MAKTAFFCYCNKDYISPITGYSFRKGDVITETCRMQFFPELSGDEFGFGGVCITTHPIQGEVTSAIRRPGIYPEILAFKEYI